MLPYSVRLAIATVSIALCVQSNSLGQIDLWPYGGRTVAGGSDFNGDGIEDVVVGSPPDGEVKIYSGADHRKELFVFEGSPQDQFGASVAVVGDLDGGGTDDVLVGVPLDDTVAIDAGAVWIISGEDGSVRHLYGESPGDLFGIALAGGGFDLNQDGFGDVIISSPGAASGLGTVSVYSGVDGQQLRMFLGTGDSYGYSVDVAGDVNADGVPDVIVGQKDLGIGHFNGAAIVYSGVDGAILFTFIGDSAKRLGTSVAGLGDLDYDGYDDVAAGAPHSDRIQGYVRLFSGRDGSTLDEIRPPDRVHEYGVALVSVGDVDGDGTSDLAVGAAGTDTNIKTDIGSVLVYSGMTRELLFRVDGSSDNDRLGTWLGGADVNGDGFADVLGGSMRNVRAYALAVGSGVQYGTGCPGTGGLIPELSFSGYPMLGLEIEIHVRQARGGADAILLLGLLGRTELPFLGCQILVQPPFAAMPFKLNGLTGAPGYGEADFPFAFPIEPNLSDAQINLQVIVFDFAGPGRVIATSNGLEIVIG